MELSVLGIESDEKRSFSFLTRNYLVLILTAALWNIGFSVTETYFSLFVFELGGTETTIGLILALGSASYVFSVMVGGQLADLYGRRKLLGFMTLVSGASQVLLAVAPSWQFLALATIIVSLCWVMEPAFWAMLADSIDERRRGGAFAVFSWTNFLPWVIMPYVGGYLIDLEGVLIVMRWMYVVLATLGMAAGILRFFLLKETPIPSSGLGKRSIGLKKSGQIVKEALMGHFRLWFSMPRPILALAATYVVWSFEFGLVGPYWIVYAEEQIGLTSFEWGTVVAVGSLISLFLKLLIVGKVLDRFQRRRILLVILGFDIPTHLLFILCNNFFNVILLWSYASVIWSFYEATYSSIEADLVPKEIRGRTYAAFGVAWSAFSIPASLLGGVIYETISPQLSFILASIVVVICITVTAKFVRIKGSLFQQRDRNLIPISR